MSAPCAFTLWLVYGNPACGEPSVGVSHLGNPYCERHAPKCRHARQTWWHIKLPCAVVGCREGYDGDGLKIPLPQRPSFRLGTALPLSPRDIQVEYALFERNEYREEGGKVRWWQWDQKAGPRPQAGIAPVPQERA